MISAPIEERYEISLPTVYSELLQIYFACQARGLTQSCKWIGDLITSVNIPSEKVDIPPNPLTELPANHLPTFLFARSLFDAREYDQCAQILKPLVTSFEVVKSGEIHCHPLIYFLHIYSIYLACEKRRANDQIELRRVFEPDGSTKPSQIAHARCSKELSALRIEIERYTKNNKPETLARVNCFLLYVFGLVYRRLGVKTMATDYFTQAINLNPCLWPAWYELSSLVKDKEHLNNLALPRYETAWMRYFFEAKVLLKLNEGERALCILHRLANSGFQNSGNLQAEIGLAYDTLRQMDLAEKHFHQLFTKFPCRLDNVDAYSNVLFVREQSVELAHLTHRCAELDKYHPETCCVIGNFFSLRGQHDRAVLYFQRALKLRPSYSLVWTLVGHEYTELRNTNAAVHAYRQAIAHNPHDYRAWYGLGQMYEILDLPSFALYYYREAQYLVPTDSRLIVALGEIYERMGRLNEAKKCFWRAHCVGDIEGNALVRLALCFAQCNETAEAAAAYTEFVKLCERNGVHNHADLAQAYKYLATYHLQVGHYEDSAAAASKCLEFAETREEAKALFRQITLLAGDVELALADTEDPASLNEDELADNGGDVLKGNACQLKDLPMDKLQLQDTPCPGSSGLMTTATVGPPQTSVDNEGQTLGQTKPLDLSLSHLLSVLGKTSGLTGPNPTSTSTTTDTHPLFDIPSTDAANVVASSSLVETPLRTGIESRHSSDSALHEDTMNLSDDAQ